jgi:hypothetical protein
MTFLQECGPMGISIPSKFYWSMTTRFWRADIKSCQKACFFGPSVLMETHSALYALLLQYIRHSYVSKAFKYDLRLCISQNVVLRHIL